MSADSPDALMSRSFLRLMAALAGVGLVDHHHVALALVDGLAGDPHLVPDLSALTDRCIAGTTEPVLVRGHLAILAELMRLAPTESARELRPLVDLTIRSIPPTRPT